MTFDFFGYNQEIVPFALSLVTVVAVRLMWGFSDRERGAFRRETMKLLLAAIFVLAFDLTTQPTIGIAVLTAAGIGVSIIGLIEIAGDAILRKGRAIADATLGTSTVQHHARNVEAYKKAPMTPDPPMQRSLRKMEEDDDQ